MCWRDSSHAFVNPDEPRQRRRVRGQGQSSWSTDRIGGNLTNLTNADIINTNGVSFQWSFVRFVRFVFFKRSTRMANSTLRIQQYHYLPLVSVASPSLSRFVIVIREILNTDGVSFQWSFVRFVRFVFFKITVSVCIGLWASLGLFYNTNLTNQPNADMRNAFGVWNLTNNDRRRTMVSFCAYLRSVGEIFPCRMPHSTSPHSHISHTTFHTQHITFHILNTPPPNLHYFSHRAPPHVQICNSQRIIATGYHSAAYRLNVTVRCFPLGLPHHETPSFASRSLPFRSPIPYLSHLDP